MPEVINKKVKLSLVGVDVNAYAILGVFRRQAKKEGWSEKEIEAVMTEAKSKDYGHLLATIGDQCVSPLDGDDE